MVQAAGQILVREAETQLHPSLDPMPSWCFLQLQGPRRGPLQSGLGTQSQTNRLKGAKNEGGGLNYKEVPERDYQWDVGIIQGACPDRGAILCLSVESSLLR